MFTYYGCPIYTSISTAIETAKDNDEGEANGGWQVTLTTEVRAKVGPVVVRNRLNTVYSDFGIGAGREVWYDPFEDGSEAP